MGKWLKIESNEAIPVLWCLKPDDHKGFSFYPGQFAWIKAGKTPFGIGQHPISMSSIGDVEPIWNCLFDY